MKFMDRKMYLSALLGLMVTGLMGLTAIGSNSDLLTANDDGDGAAAPLTPQDNVQTATPASQPTANDNNGSTWSSDQGGDGQAADGNGDATDEDDEDDEDDEEQKNAEVDINDISRINSR